MIQYTHPTDDVAAMATLSMGSGTEATGYPLANLVDRDPAHPFKTNESAFAVVLAFAAPVAPTWVSLIHPNAGIGIVMTLKGNSSNSFGSPLVSRNFQAGSYHEDGFPVNLDVFEALGAYQYWQIAGPANVVTWSIGELIFSTHTVRVLDEGFFLTDSPEDEEDHPATVHKTDAGVRTTQILGTRPRWTRGAVKVKSTAADQIRSWNRAAFGMGSPFLIRRDSEPQYVIFEDSPLKKTYIDAGAHFALSFEELSRGLKPTPSAV